MLSKFKIDCKAMTLSPKLARTRKNQAFARKEVLSISYIKY